MVPDEIKRRVRDAFLASGFERISVTDEGYKDEVLVEFKNGDGRHGIRVCVHPDFIDDRLPDAISVVTNEIREKDNVQ